MKNVSKLIIVLVALSHVGFMVLEMFLWDHPIGHRVFSMTSEFASASARLAMNQGLYNGFLAAGLCWGLLREKRDVKIFFLICISVAGIFGALTVKLTILFIQALPALLALALILWIKAPRVQP